MKILYIHQYFITPSEPGGTRSYWIAKEMVKRGHDVIMITSTNNQHPEPKRVDIDGIEVVYVKNAYSQSMSALHKIKSFLNFMYLSISAATKEKNVDLVFATSTPLTVGGVALYLKLFKKWSYIFEVRDLWPEFPIQIGAIKNPFIKWALRKFERAIYKHSEFVIALSPGMMDGVIAAGTPKEKTCVIPNMSKPDTFYPRDINTNIAKEYKIDLGKFNIIHTGSMGVANGLDYVIDTAKLLKQHRIDNIQFILMGGGATLHLLKDAVERNSLENVHFISSQPQNIVAEVMNCCQASLTSFKNLPILYTNSPNKLFDSLSAGLPIIVNSAGWTKDLVEKEDCGFFVDPSNPNDFVDKLLRYTKDSEQLRRWGENARNLSLNVFDKNILTKQVVDVIEQVNKR